MLHAVVLAGLIDARNLNISAESTYHIDQVLTNE